MGFEGGAGTRGPIVWSQPLCSEVDPDIVFGLDIDGVVGLEGGGGG